MRKRSDLRCWLARTAAAGIAACGRSRRSDTDEQNFAADRERPLSRHRRAIAPPATPRPDGGKPFAGGRPIETPFGNSSRAEHHAGSRDRHRRLERRRIRQRGAPAASGRDGERLYPAMPYTSYTKMSREDVLAIRAYLNTVEPVHNPVDRQHAAVPVQHPRLDAGVGRALFQAGRVQARSAEIGGHGIAARFLVKGPATAAPATRRRTFLGGDKSGEYPAAARSCRAGLRPTSPTTSATGFGRWSVDEIVELLKTGPQPHHRRRPARWRKR